MKGFKVPRVRLLPAVIFVAVLMLSVRLGDLWQDVSRLDQVAVGQSQAQAEGAATPEPPRSVSGASPAPEPPPPVLPALTPPVAASAVPASAVPAPAPQVAQAAPLPAPPQGGDAKPNPAVSQGAASVGDPLTEPVDLTQSEIELLQRLAERREVIEQRARELDQREALLTAAEQRIDRKIAELRTLEGTITGLLTKHDEQEQQKVAQLVKIYATMKPKDAARIFDDLDMPILITVLENMKEAASAPILAAMDPAKARLVTEEMSRRRRIPVPGQPEAGERG